jgi:hypothetical protein
MAVKLHLKVSLVELHIYRIIRALKKITAITVHKYTNHANNASDHTRDISAIIPPKKFSDLSKNGSSALDNCCLRQHDYEKKYHHYREELFREGIFTIFVEGITRQIGCHIWKRQLLIEFLA